MHHHGLEPTPAWPWQASAEQVLAAENAARQRRGMGAMAIPSRDWTYLLSDKQQQYVREQESRWKADHGGADPSANPDCCIDVTQQPELVQPSDQQLPTFRRSSTKIWSPARGRWMLPVEQALAMGYPVVPAAAGAAAVPLDVAVGDFLQGGRGQRHARGERGVRVHGCSVV